MSWLNILAISVGLAMDAFAVAIAAGLTIPQLTYRHVFRLSFHFGLFQFLMPIVGWLAGRTVATYIESWDHWLAFGMLSYVGGKMLWEALPHERSKQDDARDERDPTRGMTLVTLSIATSIDALAVGLSMAFLGVSVWMPSVIIGIVAGTLTVVGMRFGSRIGARFGKLAEIVGGIVLLAIGARILLTHLLV